VTHVRRAFLLTLAGATLLAAACTRAKPEKGSSLAVARIVSISPSTTEALFAIGAGSRVVGRSRYCNWPPEVAALPSVGGFVDPNLEAILGLRPDLVVGARGPSGTSMTERLEARGIATLFPPTETFAQIDAMIVALGARVGRETEARAAVASIDGRVAAIEKSVASRPRVKVLVVFGLAPVSAAGPGSFVDEMIRRAGGSNAVTEGAAYPLLGMERVLALDPDLVVNAAMAETGGKDRLGADSPGWSTLRAVAAGRVARITDESVLRPGPRIADGLATLARAFHPEVDLDGGAP